MCYKVLKMRIEPDSSQRKVIDDTIDYNRYVFNFLITANKLTYAKEERILSEFEMNNLCTKLRKRWPCFRKMHSMTHNDVSRRVRQACEKCRENAVRKRDRAVEKGTIPAGSPINMSWPRYRKQGRYDSYAHLSKRDFGLEYDVNKSGKRVRKLRLGKVKGLIRCYNQDTPLPGEPKTCIISRKDMGTHMEYYACISCEYTAPEPDEPSEPKAVGVDMGIRHMAATSDGKLYDHSNDMRNDLKKLKKLSQRLSRDRSDPVKERKARSKLRHHHRNMVNKRKENIERISKEMVDNNDIIVMEKLNVKKLWGKSLSKSMTRGFVNSSLGLLRNRIQSKAECAGKRIIEVNPKGTSQMCSQCGAEVKKKLNIRMHSCPFCGLAVDRDINAAINILHRGWTGHPVPAKDESPTAMIGGEARTETFADRSTGSLRCVKVRLIIGIVSSAEEKVCVNRCSKCSVIFLTLSAEKN
ncbi:MAG: transposase [Candidatus Methanomethylophilaceae archaeon]|nr:transposase [Candidatus Methanomethylophilaceae archaeon]